MRELKQKISTREDIIIFITFLFLLKPGKIINISCTGPRKR